MSAWVAFLMGLFVGVNLGFIVLCLFSSGHESVEEE